MVGDRLKAALDRCSVKTIAQAIVQRRLEAGDPPEDLWGRGPAAGPAARFTVQTSAGRAVSARRRAGRPSRPRTVRIPKNITLYYRATTDQQAVTICRWGFRKSLLPTQFDHRSNPPPVVTEEPKRLHEKQQNSRRHLEKCPGEFRIDASGIVVCTRCGWLLISGAFSLAERPPHGAGALIAVDLDADTIVGVAFETERRGDVLRVVAESREFLVSADVLDTQSHNVRIVKERIVKDGDQAAIELRPLLPDGRPVRTLAELKVAESTTKSTSVLKPAQQLQIAAVKQRRYTTKRKELELEQSRHQVPMMARLDDIRPRGKPGRPKGSMRKKPFPVKEAAEADLLYRAGLKSEEALRKTAAALGPEETLLIDAALADIRRRGQEFDLRMTRGEMMTQVLAVRRNVPPSTITRMLTAYRKSGGASDPSR